MADQPNNLTTLNGLFKETYSDKIKNIIPEGVKLVKEIQFVSKDKQNGHLYHMPVVLGLEHGVAFSTTGDAFTLSDAISGAIKDAQVQGAQMLLRSVLSYTAASRALSGGASAFESATKFLVGNMMRSMARKLEANVLYGQMGYGTVSAVSGAGPYTLTITTAQWAPGIWAGAENMKIEFVDSAYTAVHGVATVTAVDMDARQLTVSLDSGTIAIATDVIFHKGSFGNEAAGIHKILTNTGTLFNISAATYNLWKGNQFAVGGALSVTKILSAAARCVEKGLDQDVRVYVNPRTWADLISAETARRTYDGSYKPGEMENGAQSIKFHGQNGQIEIIPSIFVKEGFGYMLITEEAARVGSSDLTFKRPGQGDEFFKDLELAAGYELRLYSDQAVFLSCPGKMCLLTGIVNS